MAALSESELPRAHRGAVLAWGLASDAALARATAAGHDGAFAAVFARYHAPLVRYCRSILLDADDAQDAAQQAFAAALRALRGDRALPLALRPWLYAIARNEALAVARRRRPGVAVTELDAEAAAVAAPDDADTRERFAELLADLRALPDRQRDALVLRELEGLSYEEIAGALQMTASAARQAVFEARAGLTALGAGRATACADIRRALSDGDGRTRHGRTLRAHLDGCAGCSAFADSLQARRRALRALFPLGPGVVALAGGGAGLAGGGAAAGGWVLAGVGSASVAGKCAALCATAALVGGSLAALEHGAAHQQHRHSGPASATASATPLPRPARTQIAAPARPATAVTLAASTTGTARTVSLPVAHHTAAQPHPRAHARVTADHVQSHALRHVAQHAASDGAATVPTPTPPPAAAPAPQPQPSAAAAASPGRQAIQQALADAAARRQAAADAARQQIQQAVTQAQQTIATAQQTAQQTVQHIATQTQQLTQQAMQQVQRFTQSLANRTTTATTGAAVPPTQ